MLKQLVVLSMILVCCYCVDHNELLTEETRAKKSKKKTIRMIAMVLIFIFSKLAIFKIASFFFFLAFFQKLFAFGGVLLTYMMKNQASTAPAPMTQPMAQPISMYGPPSDYNTVGYSYGPPDHEPVMSEGPSIADLGGAFKWLSGKQSLL